MACNKDCNCFICQSNKIKKRNTNNNLQKIAKEFENKSGGIISKKDIYNIAKIYKNKGE